MADNDTKSKDDDSKSSNSKRNPKSGSRSASQKAGSSAGKQVGRTASRSPARGTTSAGSRAASAASRSSAAPKGGRRSGSARPKASAASSRIPDLDDVTQAVRKAGRAIPKTVSKAGKTATRVGHRAADAAADAGAGLAGTGKYLAAGALVGAAAGAAFEAARKRHDNGEARQGSEEDDDQEGVSGFASRAFDTVSDFATHIGNMAINAFEALAGGGEEEGASEAHGSERASRRKSQAKTGFGDGSEGRQPRPRPSRGQPGADQARGFGGDDEGEQADEPDFWMVRGQTSPSDEMDDQDSNELEAASSGGERDQRPGFEEAEEDGVLSRPKRRRRKLDPILERNWEA